jgi:hypothetical protein
MWTSDVYQLLTFVTECRSNFDVSFVSIQDWATGYTERMSQGDLVVVQSYGTEGEAEVGRGAKPSCLAPRR